jgi:hypothetical protein
MRLNESNLILHGLSLQLKLLFGLIKLFLYNGLNVIDFLEQKQRLFHQFRIGGGANLKNKLIEIPVTGVAIEIADLVVDDLVGQLALGLL